MSEHIETINRNQISKQITKQLSQRSDQKGLVQLFGHVGLLCLTALTISQAESGCLFLIALLVHGIILSFVFAPLHETIHHTAFKSSHLNNWVASIF
jgi:fatty acid desaturase